MDRGKPEGLPRGLVIRAAVLLTLLSAGLLTFPYLWPLLTERERIESWLAANRVAGAFGLIVLNALQVVVAPLPGALLGWISGYWFGPWWGSLLTWVGVSLGNGLTMALARGLGRPLLVAFLPRERLARMERLIQRYGLTVVIVVFLLPLTPDDLLAWAIGLSPLPLIPAFAVSTLARLVHVLIANAVGAYLRSGEPLWLAVAASLSVAALLLAWRIAGMARVSPLEIYREDAS
ncbi:TVP38/TMEM64 family inner membrane protein YdjZ [Candidatus Thermoflexus japonica]|uniref:TVP38/TMEM64 family membrane protein n=1 Tax=Candidatus Thermoflexus japonica TaxID=2035417 RepID=A0A2H5Y674_9CHLR|nr:TVP38/TMEM64 family inner membrane protein YdjZ [Candidatus Thermoflexus japonica]